MESAQPIQSLPRPVTFLHPGVTELVACGLSALVYVATLSFGFVYDDVPQILKNPAIQSWGFVPQYFTSHVWAAIYPSSTGNYYRPLFLLWLRLNYALFGTDAVGWHMTCIACHVLATWLVFWIAQKLTTDRLTAFLAALIFGVHPAHIENVAWISGITDPLMTCFVLGSVWAFLSFHESRKLEQLTLSLTLFAFALLSKETAIILPALIFAFAMLVADKNGNKSLLRRLFLAVRACVPYLLLTAIYVLVRLAALGKWSRPTIPISWTEVLLTWPAVLWFYMRHLILPTGLSEFYSLDYVTKAAARPVLLPLVLVSVVLLVLFFLIRWLSQKNIALFAVVLIVAPLLPVLDLRSLTAGDIVHDRYLYLPSVGFAILVACAIRELNRLVPADRRHLMPIAITVVVGACFAVLTVVQQVQWADDVALYTRGLESAPANLTVRDNLANSLLAANQPARAIPLYLDVLQRNPRFWRSNYNLGFAYYKMANYSGAEDYLQRAISIDPSDADQYIYLALAQLQLKKLSEAAENAERAIARNPQARGYHSVLALISEAAGDRTRAKAEYRTEIAQHPENAAAAAELQKLEGTQIPSQR